jgi:hypothetical protein
MAQQEALRLAGPKFMRHFNLKEEPDTLRNDYGGEFGQRCLLSRRLVQAGVRFIEVSHNLNFMNGTGWDIHNEGYKNQHLLIQELDTALSALIRDLEGQEAARQDPHRRRHRIRPPAGVRRSRRTRSSGHHVLHGPRRWRLEPLRRVWRHDELAKKPVENPVPLVDFHATIHAAMGIDPAHVPCRRWRQACLADGSRPVPITDGGKPIAALFGPALSFNVFPIHGATMEPHGDHNGQRSFPSEERSKPSPEWNHYRITGNNGTLTLAVNGKVVSGGDKCFWRKGYLALESEGAPVEFRNVRIKELPSTGATEADSAPLDQDWKHLYNGLDLRGWKVPAGAEARWKSSNWNLQLIATDGQEGTPLWSETEIANGEFIADFQLLKSADLSNTLHRHSACVAKKSRRPHRHRQSPHRLRSRQSETRQMVSPPPQTRRHQSHRHPHRNPGRQSAGDRSHTRRPSQRPVGIADFGTPVTFANFFVRE